MPTWISIITLLFNISYCEAAIILVEIVMGWLLIWGAGAPWVHCGADKAVNWTRFCAWFLINSIMILIYNMEHLPYYFFGYILHYFWQIYFYGWYWWALSSGWVKTLWVLGRAAWLWPYIWEHPEAVTDSFTSTIVALQQWFSVAFFQHKVKTIPE